jgi:hypothetical protein
MAIKVLNIKVLTIKVLFIKVLAIKVLAIKVLAIKALAIKVLAIKVVIHSTQDSFIYLFTFSQKVYLQGFRLRDLNTMDYYTPGILITGALRLDFNTRHFNPISPWRVFL